MNNKLLSILILSIVMSLSAIALSEQQQPELTIDQAQQVGLRSYIAYSDYGPLVAIRDDGTCDKIEWNDFLDYDFSEWKQVKYICSDTIGNYAAIREDGTVLCTCNYLPVDNWHDIKMLGFNRYYDYYDQEGLNGENSHIVGLQKDGKVVAAGVNSFGECDVENWNSIVDVAVGENFTIGLREDGSVIATGDNSYEQCNVEGWNDIVDVAAARFSSYGLRSDGSIVATGYIDEYKNVSAEAPNWENIIAIKAYNERSEGIDYIVGLKKDGTLVTNSSHYAAERNSAKASDLVSFDCASWGTVVSLNSNGYTCLYGTGREYWKDSKRGLKAEKVEWAEKNPTSTEKQNAKKESILNGKQYFFDDALETFSVPIFYNGDTTFLSEYGERIKQYGHSNDFFSDSDYDLIEEFYEYQRFLDFCETDEQAENALPSSIILTGPFSHWRFGQYFEEGPFEVVEDELYRIDGHYARLAILHTDCEELGGDIYISSIVYIRNDQMIALGFVPFAANKKVTMEDLHTIADLITYDETKATWTAKDGEFSLESKDNTTVLSAGKKTQLVVNYNNPKRANEKIKSVSNTSYIKENGAMNWSVVDAETGETVEKGVSVDSKGNVIVEKELTDIRKVVVKAKSNIFNTTGEYSLTLMPIVSSISTDKSELFFYTGTDTTENVRVALEPSTIPPIGIVWKTKKDGIVDISANDDGTVSIKPVAAGKTEITVTEPGGKSVRLNANVVAPVEQVELKLSGKQIPGGKVAVKETLLPKNVGNKKVEWSLNVDESVATINEKGQINISKDAAVGTKIIVTCKALGAPEPVESTIEFEIKEK